MSSDTLLRKPSDPTEDPGYEPSDWVQPLHDDEIVQRGGRVKRVANSVANLFRIRPKPGDPVEEDPGYEPSDWTQPSLSVSEGRQRSQQPEAWSLKTGDDTLSGLDFPPDPEANTWLLESGRAEEFIYKLYAKNFKKFAKTLGKKVSKEAGDTALNKAQHYTESLAKDLGSADLRHRDSARNIVRAEHGKAESVDRMLREISGVLSGDEPNKITIGIGETRENIADYKRRRSEAFRSSGDTYGLFPPPPKYRVSHVDFLGKRTEESAVALMYGLLGTTRPISGLIPGRDTTANGDGVILSRDVITGEVEELKTQTPAGITIVESWQDESGILQYTQPDHLLPRPDNALVHSIAFYNSKAKDQRPV
jgi:hypothetical protein